MYRRYKSSWMKHLDFVILDEIVLQVSLYLAYVLWVNDLSMYDNWIYANLAQVLFFFDLFLLLVTTALKNVLKRGYLIEMDKSFRHVVAVALVGGFYLFAIKNAEDFSRMTFGLTMVFYGIFSYLTRLLWKRVVLRRLKESTKKSLLVVTDLKRLEQMKTESAERKETLQKTSGIAVLDLQMSGDISIGSLINGIPVVSDQEGLLDYVQTAWVDEVLLDTTDRPDELRALEMKLAEMGIVVHRRLGKVSEMYGTRQFVQRFGGETVLTTSINYASTEQLFLKRLMDIVGALIGCTLTVILCLVLGPILMVKSPGPIFFKQERVGRNGKHFMIYKFRSMYPDAEEKKQELMEKNRIGDGMMFKLEQDPRIIGSKVLPDGTYKKGIGNFIRDWSLDEFPQFFNVLKGDMSLVGTRPPTVDEWEKYDSHHRARMAIKPGITGLWQVSGRSNITCFEDIVKLDTQYISEWSIATDLKIIVKTFRVVFRRDGSM